MKKQIVDCLYEMIKENFGEDKWDEIREKAGLNNFRNVVKYFNNTDTDIYDKKVYEVIYKTCEVLKINMTAAADAFGDYWINIYAPKNYREYYGQYTSAKEFILAMDKIHGEVTRQIENAHPPRFETEIVNEDKIKVKYISKRKMIIFYIGLVKGIGKYFGEKINIQRLSDEDVIIEFLGKNGIKNPALKSRVLNPLAR